ncbi:hypothetical protein BDZ91DRAFT_710988 [Kalaharituber pfeilii]|nr:hypothetical protein BDZ91DRAFT_710988 [Kalaharituber pfeilii]
MNFKADRAAHTTNRFDPDQKTHKLDSSCTPEPLASAYYTYRIAHHFYANLTIVRCLVIEPQPPASVRVETECCCRFADSEDPRVHPINHNVIPHLFNKRDALRIVYPGSLRYRQPWKLCPEGLLDLLHRFGLPTSDAYVDAFTYKVYVLLPNIPGRLPRLRNPVLLSEHVAYPLEALVVQPGAQRKRPVGPILDCLALDIEQEGDDYEGECGDWEGSEWKLDTEAWRYIPSSNSIFST